MRSDKLWFTPRPCWPQYKVAAKVDSISKSIRMQQQSPALMSVTWPPTPNSVAASFDLVTDIANPSELQKQSSNHSKCNALNLTSFDVESYNEKAQMKFVPPPETERVEDYAYCLLCESGRGESDLSQHETLLCKHILCVTCVSAIIDAGTSSPASAAEALLSGFPCPFRCSEGRLGGVAEGRKCLKIKENFMRNVFACAFKKAKDESSKPTAFNRVTMERLFKSKFSLLMNDHVNQDLEKTSLWMTEGIDSVLRTRRFLNCRCGAIVIGGLQTCQDELESNSSLHDLKCNRCSGMLDMYVRLLADKAFSELF